MRKGYITVFFAVSMALVISLFMVLISGIRLSTSRLKAECAVDTALTSQFAQYNSILWKNYGLIFVDSAYGQSMGGIKKAERQLKNCINTNFDETDLSVLGMVDLNGLNVNSCDITGIRFATDQNGLAIVEQVKALMNYKLGTGYLEEILSFASTVNEYVLDPSEYIEKANSANSRLTSEFDIHDYQGWVNTVDPDVNDSDEYNLSYFSILRKIVSDTGSISKERINTQMVVSNRQINEGNLATDYKMSSVDKLIFKQYLYEILASYLYTKEDTKLAYQCEYLIFGKNSDIQNLELSAKRIMFIRLAADITSLLSDSEKMEKIQSFCKIVASLLACPEAAGLMEIVIVAGWSYFESLADMKLLFSGKEVPFYKSSGEWLTSLAGIFSGNENAECENGLSYRDYVRAFIFLSNHNSLISRFFTIIETDVRNCGGYEAFRIDNCYDYIEADISLESTSGFTYTTKRRRGVNHN